MTRQKLCEWNDCELVSKQNEVESFIDMSFESGLKLLQYKYPITTKIAYKEYLLKD